MSTIYDWMTIALFAGLIVLFLQRSTDDGPEVDSILHYLPPSIGCAVVNYLGNEGHDAAALAVLAVTLGYVWMVLKPFVAGRER
ncbi:MAG TPA: hypothetical protein VJM81_05570 [Rhizorhapis sp.]|nr:hypothetical protein [Rhizorhapis sp.]